LSADVLVISLVGKSVKMSLGCKKLHNVGFVTTY
jgi:hypothetical protein